MGPTSERIQLVVDVWENVSFYRNKIYITYEYERDD